MATLKELLGSAFKEGMTIEEAEKALEKMNLADLNSGNYISKEKAARERTEAVDKAKADYESGNADSKKAMEDLKKENETLKAEKDAAAYKEKLVAKGIDPKYQSYVQSLYQMDDKLDANLDTFVKENPGFLINKDDNKIKFTPPGKGPNTETPDYDLGNAIDDTYGD